MAGDDIDSLRRRVEFLERALSQVRAASGVRQKKAKDKDEAFTISEMYEGIPHAWLQWKGTSVCMDFYCKCGASLHVHGDFVYHVKCGLCNTVYFCNGHIELIELEVEPDHLVTVALPAYGDEGLEEADLPAV